MNQIIITDKIITNKIYFIRNQKVMLDVDLAALCSVEKNNLKDKFVEI